MPFAEKSVAQPCGCCRSSALIVGIIGSIYAGLASPTEAAAIGVMLSLLLSWFSGTLNRQEFWRTRLHGSNAPRPA